MTEQLEDSVASCPVAGPTNDEPPFYPMARERPLEPPPLLGAVHAAGKVIRVRIWDDTRAWLITDFDQVRQVLSDPRVGSDIHHPNYPHTGPAMKTARQASKTIIVMDNPDHDRLRRMLTREFTVKRMEAWRPRVQQMVDGLIDQMLAQPAPVDLVQTLALPLPTMLICELLGLPYEDRELFHRTTKITASRTATPEESRAAQVELLDRLGSLIDQKLEEPGDDLISRMLTEHVKTGALSRDEALSMTELLMIAGHETSAHMIAMGTLTLLLHPASSDDIRVSEDPAVVANVVEELLRWLTVLHIGRRRVALEDLEVGGQQIKAGDAIIASIEAANRCPVVFPNPHEFDIHRDTGRHMAFGFGIHQCLGQPLARIELQVLWSTLFRRVPTLALAANLDELNFREGVVYGVEELPVTW